MEMLNDVLSDEATSFSINSSLNNKRLQGMSSVDTNDLLQYHGAGPMSPYASSQRSNSTCSGFNNMKNSNNGNHHRSYCNSAKLRISSVNNDEEDLLDEFFNTVQEYVCKQKEMETKISESGHSSQLYQKDVIDFVFENVENVTCNQPKDAKNDPDLQETLDKLQTLGHSVQLKLYHKNPEEIQKSVDEWFLDSLMCAKRQPAGQPLEEASPDFKDLFMQRMKQVVCAQVPAANQDDINNQTATEQRDDKDALDQVFEKVESAVCKSADLADVYPLHRAETPSLRSGKSPQAYVASPGGSAESSTFAGTPRSIDGEGSTYMSVGSDSDHSRSTYASSVGTYSYTEHSRQTYSALSPRSEASSTCFSPRSTASNSAHSRSHRSGGGSERDTQTLLSDSSSHSDDDDDETTAFDTVSRPLFVITEEVSATESMASEQVKKEKEKRQQDVIDTKKGKEKYPFRYSSAHYKFDKQKCHPDTATKTAQDWLERFKHAVEVTVVKLSSVMDTMSFDAVCKTPVAKPVHDQDTIMDDLEQRSAHHSTMEQIQESITTDIANMCGERTVLDDPEEKAKAENVLLNGLVDRSKFASVSIMPSVDEEDEETTAFGGHDEDDEDDDQPFDVGGYNNVPDYHTATYYQSIRRPKTRQQEPPEDIRKMIDDSLRAIRTTSDSIRGRDPEPSFQLKLHKEGLVSSLRSYTQCVPANLSDGSGNTMKLGQLPAIRSPRSSETEKTAEMTLTTFGASGTLHDDDEEDIHSGSPSNLALQHSKGQMDMVVCLPNQKATVVDQTPKQGNGAMTVGITIPDSSTHSSRTKKDVSNHSATFHTAHILSVFDDDTHCYQDDEDDSKLSYESETYFSNLSEMDIKRTCTDIVVYEPKPDFVKLAMSSPWQLVVYVAWLSVSFLVRINGEVNSHLAERKEALQALLERQGSNADLMTAFSQDSIEAIPSIDLQISLQ